MPEGVYHEKQLAELQEAFEGIEAKTNNLLLKVMAHSFSSEKAKEFAHHGFCRRLQTLRRCVQNVFEIVPPDTVVVPDRERLHDAQINLQAFIANAFGCADNLAWVWVHERGMAATMSPLQVGLRTKNVSVRQSLPPALQRYLASIDGWFEYLTDYRDALAHRIPLYIPPGAVRPNNLAPCNDLQDRMNQALLAFDGFEYERLAAEQAKLFFFYPMITHSLQETIGVVHFHPQIIADFRTVEELAIKVFDELTTQSP